MTLRCGEILAREPAIHPGSQRFRVDTLLRRRRIGNVFTLRSQERFDRSVALAGVVTHWQIQETGDRSQDTERLVSFHELQWTFCFLPPD
jgi:hypothetical protein